MRKNVPMILTLILTTFLMSGCISEQYWGWKLATDPDDVYNFINGLGAYEYPVKDAKISVIWKGNHPEFYVFYQSGTEGQPSGNWGWKLATDPDDVMNFLNGQGAYKHLVTTARIAAMKKDGYFEFYVFYQRSMTGEPISNWGWKLATDPDDVKDFLSGQGAYSQPVKGSEICAIWKDDHTEFYIFHNEGAKVWLQSPISDERLVNDEILKFKAIVTSDLPVDGSQLQWVSNIDGSLGSGPEIEIDGLSLGTHKIEVTGYGDKVDIPIRVFEDLWELYQSPLSQGEIDRIMKDFTINWIDGDVEDEKWGTYEPFEFDQESTDPSKVVAIAKLDVLRHQQFSEPLPFTNGKSPYDHFRTYVNTINLRLDCNFNTGGGGAVSLNRGFNVWDGRSSGTPDNPDACKTPFANPVLYKYINPLYLLLHEGRHNEPSDSGHISCKSWWPPDIPEDEKTETQCDPTLEEGSGHAQAALYSMWVYKYGLYDSPSIKEEAKTIATSLLKSRFCSKPTHSDQKVQAIVNELLQE